MEQRPENNHIRNIKERVRNHEISFLIGAGFSRNISECFPLWKDLLKDAIKEVYDPLNSEEDIEKLTKIAVSQDGYLGIASKFVEKAGFHESIDYYIEQHIPFLEEDGKGESVIKIGGTIIDKHPSFESHYLLKRLDIGNIYTFNYDNALEFCLGGNNHKKIEQENNSLGAKLDKLQKDKDTINRYYADYVAKTTENQETDTNESKPQPALDKDELKNKFIECVEKIETDIPKEIRSGQENLSKSYEDLKKYIKKQTQATRQNICENNEKIREFYQIIDKASDISFTSGRKNIYKIHGSLRQPNEKFGFDGDKHTQYIITREDYSEYPIKHCAFANLMRIDMLRGGFCMLGLSGDDPNFLDWINWVKDVKDSSENDSSDNSFYFIYAGDTDISEDKMIMLQNHYIVPIQLKNVFPEKNTESERINAFLSYIQPVINNEESASTIFGKVYHYRIEKDIVKKLSKEEIEALCRDSLKYSFLRSSSLSQRTACQICNYSSFLLQDEVNEKLLYLIAASFNVSSAPIRLSLTEEQIDRLCIDSDSLVKESIHNAICLSNIMTNSDSCENGFIRVDSYFQILHSLYNFDFDEAGNLVKNYKVTTGLDYSRCFSIRHLLGEEINNVDPLSLSYNGAQEFVLIADWINRLTLSNNNVLYKPANEYRKRWELQSLREYINIFLEDVRRKEKISSYGNIQEVVYLDDSDPGEYSAAVLFAKLIQLGVTFEHQSVIKQEDWLEIVRKLVRYYPYPLMFYTLVRNDNEEFVKRISEEFLYDRQARCFLPDIVAKMIKAFSENSTPNAVKQSISYSLPILLKYNDARVYDIPDIQFDYILGEVLDEKNPFFRSTYVKLMESILSDIATKEQKITAIRKVLSIQKPESEENAIVIATIKGIDIKDFEPYNNELMMYAANSKLTLNGKYILYNLSWLLTNNNFRKIQYELIDAFRTVDNLKYDCISLLKKKGIDGSYYLTGLLNEDNIWGVISVNQSVFSGNYHPSFFDVGKVIRFREEQISLLAKGIVTTLQFMESSLEKTNGKDYGFFSKENIYRDVANDMFLLLVKYKKRFSEYLDYNEIYSRVKNIYDKCYFNKSIAKLLAEDETSRAISRLVYETQVFPVTRYSSEYNMLMSKLIYGKTKNLNSCFRHISWVITKYPAFFKKKDMRNMLISILDIYQPYFSGVLDLSWDFIGCEMEEAEQSLISIAATLSRNDIVHSFWGQYKSIYERNDF